VNKTIALSSNSTTEGRTMKVIGFFLAFLISGISCQGQTLTTLTTHVTATTAPRFPDVIAGLSSTGQFTVFIDLLTKSGVLPQINSSLHFTVFAPTDNAFTKLSPDAFEAIKNDPAKITELVNSHVVLNTNLRIHGTMEDVLLKTINNHQVRINTYNVLHTVTANGVNITVKNIPIVHGLAHGIDSVLVAAPGNIMQIALNRTDLSTFTGLVISSNLLNFFTADKDITLFAPNNNAFSKLSGNVMSYLQSHPADLAETLRFHVVRTITLFSLGMIHGVTIPSADNHHDNLMLLQAADGSLNVNTAKILVKDLIATDGVIHVIDTVLIPTHVLVRIQDQGIIVG
ncbi:periostin, partial [Biomphalaria glabrata]